MMADGTGADGTGDGAGAEVSVAHVLLPGQRRADVIWERRDCVSAELDDSIVLLDLETLVYHSLNVTAAAVWELLEQPRGTGWIAERLCERYAVEPGQCRASVEGLMAKLESSGLVRMAGAESVGG